MKNALFIFIFVFGLQECISQRDPLFLKERPLRIFLRSQKAIKMVKDFTDRSYKIDNVTVLIPIEAPASYWNKINRFSFDFSQASFTNWNAGGQSAISGLSDIRFRRTYKKGFVRWNNEMLIRYGLNKQANQGWRKTDDDFELVSTYGYKLSKNSKWYYTASSSFKTQFTPGYNYPNREQSISQFFAPAYFFLGVGAEFSEPKNELLFYASPLTQKTTFVLDQDLANQGSFGVRAAERDAEGNITKEGGLVRNEVGILLRNEFRKEILEDVILFSRVSLFTDYFRDFGNIDVDWEVTVDFKINQYVKARIGSHIRYDDDIKVNIETADGEQIDGGPTVQWKQLLGIGILIEL